MATPGPSHVTEQRRAQPWLGPRVASLALAWLGSLVPVVRRGLVLVAPMVVAAVVVVACAAGETPLAPADDPELVEGREIYLANCSNCHGSDGRGGRGTKLNEGFVLDRYPDQSDQEILVSTGIRAMPEFGGRLTEAEITAVVRFTREVLN